jgi:cytochrome c oxidase cbb3-type subunit III
MKISAARLAALLVTALSLAELSLAAPALAAQDRVDQANHPATPDAEAGKALFRQTCGFCHGPDGRGASGPDLIRSTLVSHDVNGNLVGEVVHTGRTDKGMPAFPLPDSQIQQIAAFLHAQAKLASTVASRMPSDYPLDKLLVGDADAGKSYFNSPGRCSGCHSPSGDLAHIAAKYKPIDLQSRIAYPYGANPTDTIRDASGHAFNGEQVYADEFFVTLKLADGSLRSFARRLVQIDSHDPLAAHISLLDQYTDKDVHDLLAYLETLK